MREQGKEGEGRVGERRRGGGMAVEKTKWEM